MYHLLLSHVVIHPAGLEEKQNIAVEYCSSPNVQADKRHTEVIFQLASFLPYKVTCSCLEEEKQFIHSAHSVLILARPSCLQRSLQEYNSKSKYCKMFNWSHFLNSPGHPSLPTTPPHTRRLPPPSCTTVSKGSSEASWLLHGKFRYTLTTCKLDRSAHYFFLKNKLIHWRNTKLSLFLASRL